MKKTIKPLLILMLGIYVGLIVNKYSNETSVITFLSPPTIHLNDTYSVNPKVEILSLMIVSQDLLIKVENKLQIPGLAQRLRPKRSGGDNCLEISFPRGSDYLKIRLSADSYDKAVLITQAIIEQLDIAFKTRYQVQEASDRMRKLALLYKKNSYNNSETLDQKEIIIIDLISQRREAFIINRAERLYRIESLIEANNLLGKVQIISGPNYVFKSHWEFILNIFYVTLLLFCVFYWRELRIFLLRQKK